MCLTAARSLKSSPTVFLNAAYRDQKKSRGSGSQPHIAALGLPDPLLPAHFSSLALAFSPPPITAGSLSVFLTQPHRRCNPRHISSFSETPIVTHTAARWPNGKAPDFGSGDCAFEPHVGRVYFFLALGRVHSCIFWTLAITDQALGEAVGLRPPVCA